MSEAREVFHCRWFLSKNPCDFEISGTEDDVLNSAVRHLVQAHRHRDTPELRDELLSSLREEDDAKAA